MKQLLFVYGTLRAGARHPMARRLARGATWLGPATLRGTLYSLGRYPGVVVIPCRRDRVLGDLYLVTRSPLLKALDRYEGCADDRPGTYAFRRLRAGVEAQGVQKEAWVYFFTGGRRGRRIVSGDWLYPHGVREQTPAL